jgi:hypothetical protein
MPDLTKQQRYEKSRDDFVKNVKTWDEWYQFADRLLRNAIDAQDTRLLLDYSLIVASFLRAMSELPEEGDILVLIDRLFYILSFESKEKLGMDVTLLTKEDIEKAKIQYAVPATSILDFLGNDDEKPTVH